MSDSALRAELVEVQRKLHLANKALHNTVYILRPVENRPPVQLAALVAAQVATIKATLLTTDPPQE